MCSILPRFHDLTNNLVGDVKVIHGQGMPSHRHHDFGNLYVQFDVKFPDSLRGPDGDPMSDEDRAKLESILPPRKTGSAPPSDAMVEDFTLEDVDPMRDGSRAQGGAMDEDDEDMHPGAERVQCASQ